MSTSFLDRGEGRIAYEVEGEGPLVVCVPGIGDLRSIFRFLTPALLEAGYRVAVMDLRGHGDSDDGFGAYDDAATASDALALVDHLGGPALLVGNSLGSSASVWAAAEDPDKVTGLVLVTAFVRDPKTNPLMKVMARAMLAKPWGPAFWNTYYRGRNAQPPADLADHQQKIKQSLRRGDHWRSFVKTALTSHAPIEARLGQVKAPVLVVIGDKDKDWPDPVGEARFVADALHGELLVVPNTGHYPIAEDPATVNPAVVAFANRVNGRA
ncbi:MAG TPA: alpha/beta hydrolase [Acidimicrobiales bacterium]|jgi:pimeloyl-ACP methyl ester carboxylesterase